MNSLDDITLIQQFVTGQLTLASNQNLRIETADDTSQLLTRRGSLLATIRRPASRLPSANVRRESEYWPLINQILSDACFRFIGPSRQVGFVAYQECKVSLGYRLNCTEARILWRTWWTRARGGRHGIDMDILVHTRHTWYAIQDVVCQQGTLFFKTLAGELTLQGSDLVAWLSQVNIPVPIAQPLDNSTQKAPRSAAKSPFPDYTQPSQDITPASGQTGHPSRGQQPNWDSSSSAGIQSRKPGWDSSSSAGHQTRRPGWDSSSSAGIPGQARRGWDSSSQSQPPMPPSQGHRPGWDSSSSGPPRPPQNQQNSPAGRSPMPDSSESVGMPTSQDWGDIVRIREGRLYIQTPLGEVIVEGHDLRYQINPLGKVAPRSEPVSMNQYRERNRVAQP